MSISIRSGSPTLSAVTGTTAPSVTLSGTTQPQTGDVLIIIHANDFYLLSNMPTPTVGGSTAGVTAITNGTADGGSNLGHVKSYYYVVPSTGNLTVTVAETGTHDEEKDLIVYVLSGADTTTVIDTANNAVYGTTASHALPALSPATSNAFLIAHDSSGGGVNVTSYTPPPGMTEVYDSPNSGTMGNTGAVLQLSASGSIGSLSFTPAGSANGHVVAIAVLTASAAPTADSTAVFYDFTPGFLAPSGTLTPGPYTYDSGAAPIVNATTDPEADANVTGYDTQVALTATAGEADASATAADAQASAAPNAGEADATVAAADAQAQTAATAGEADASVTGYDAATVATAAGGEADAAVTGYDAQASAAATAGQVAATAAAADATVQTNSNPSGGESDASVTGYDATASVGALASDADAAVAAYDAASVTVTVNAGEADATVTGYDAVASSAPNAGEADATVTGYDATVQTNSNPSAGEADATGTAYDATVSTSGTTNAPAGEADATATGYDASTAVTVAAGSASATVTGLDVQAAAGTNAAEADASSAAFDVSASVAPAAGAGLGTVTAYDPTVSSGPSAESAAAGATAYDATVSAPVSVFAPFVTAAATAYDATVIQAGGVIAFVTVDSYGTVTGYADQSGAAVDAYDSGGTGQGADEGDSTGRLSSVDGATGSYGTAG